MSPDSAASRRPSPSWPAGPWLPMGGCRDRIPTDDDVVLPIPIASRTSVMPPPFRRSSLVCGGVTRGSVTIAVLVGPDGGVVAGRGEEQIRDLAAPTLTAVGPVRSTCATIGR
jgi:hypothetical protein